jgi:hypothetical protein
MQNNRFDGLLGITKHDELFFMPGELSTAF